MQDINYRNQHYARGVKMALGLANWLAIGAQGSAQSPKYLVIFTGESNSGGRGLNSDLSAPELTARPSVKIWNNVSSVIESLDIGTNNLLAHNGLDAVSTVEHGWEAGLANAVEANRLGDSYCYLLKTGQGGSLISQWSAESANWAAFVARYTAMRAAITEAVTPVVWYSQGINDGIASTDVNAWSAATIEHLARIRTLVGSTAKIVMTVLPAAYNAYNAKIADIVTNDPLTLSVITSDLPMRDANHWNAYGQQVISERMIDAMFSGDALTAPSLSPAAGEYGTDISCTITGDGTIRYTTDGTGPVSSDTAYSTPVAITSTTTVKAVAQSPRRKSSSVASAIYTRVGPWEFSSVDAAASGFTLADGGRQISRTTGATWALCRTQRAIASGKRYFEIKKISAPVSNQYIIVGVATAGASSASYLGGSAYGLGIRLDQSFKNGFTQVAAALMQASATVHGIAVDFDAGKIWLSAGGVWLQSGDPAAGTNEAYTFVPGTTGPIYPAVALQNTDGGTWSINSAEYDTPAGFTRLT